MDRFRINSSKPSFNPKRSESRILRTDSSRINSSEPSLNPRTSKRQILRTKSSHIISSEPSLNPRTSKNQILRINSSRINISKLGFNPKISKSRILQTNSYVLIALNQILTRKNRNLPTLRIPKERIFCVVFSQRHSLVCNRCIKYKTQDVR